jgi:hypothetical protein
MAVSSGLELASSPVHVRWRSSIHVAAGATVAHIATIKSGNALEILVAYRSVLATEVALLLDAPTTLPRRRWAGNWSALITTSRTSRRP